MLNIPLYMYVFKNPKMSSNTFPASVLDTTGINNQIHSQERFIHIHKTFYKSRSQYNELTYI